MYSKWPINHNYAQKRLRNKVNKIIKIAKQRYYQNKLQQNAGNIKKTWSTLNGRLRRKSKSYTNVELSVGGNSIEDPVCIAEEFNTFFSSIGHSLAKNLPNDIYHK